jgi:DNA-directed RNA polymerase subunit RPC12/RpoP
MPDKSNGQNPPPPESLHFERTPAKCLRCQREFDGFMIEVIEDLKQLRCGSVLVSRAELVCLHCGALFNWNVREKDIEKMAIKYGELMVVIKGYNPE